MAYDLQRLYFKKEDLRWHLFGFLGVRASFLWITAPLEALSLAESEMALPFFWTPAIYARPITWEKMRDYLIKSPLVCITIIIPFATSDNLEMFNNTYHNRKLYASILKNTISGIWQTPVSPAGNTGYLLCFHTYLAVRKSCDIRFRDDHIIIHLHIISCFW